MFLLVLLAVAACAHAQVLVEHSLAVAKAAAAANAAKGPAASIGKVFAGAGKVLSKADPQVATEGAVKAPAPVKTAAVAPPSPPPNPDDIAAGADRRDLVARFGRPSVKTSTLKGSEVIETYWYMAAGYDTVVVTLRDGKVTGVSSFPD